MWEGASARVFRTDAGRLRLGWRLLLFGLVTAMVTVAFGLALPPLVLAGSFALLAGSCVGGWLLLATDGRAPAALGFHTGPATGPECARGLGLGVWVALVAVGLTALFGGVVWAPEEGSVLGWATAGLGALAFLALPAAAEEALLRGYPLQALSEAWGVWPALLITSTAFALAHLGNPGVTPLAIVNIGVAGLWLGVVWVRTGSLWWATGAHLGWNWGSAYLADLPVSGLELFDAPFYEASMAGPDWIGGGAFGPEGSLLATLALGGATWWSWRTGRLAPSETVRAARPLFAAWNRTNETTKECT